MKDLRGIDYIKKERELFLETALPITNRLKKHLRIESNLLEIIFESLAYTLPINEAALQDFLKEQEIGSLSDLADSQYKEFIGKTQITGFKSSIGYKTRFERTWSKQMQQLLRSTIALNKKPKIIEPDDKVLRTAKQIIEQVFVPNYNSFRTEQAQKLKQRFDLKQNLLGLAYREIVNLVTNKESVSKYELEAIYNLETLGIEKGLNGLYRDLGWSDKIASLKQLRNTTKGVNNTACYHCFKTLIKENNSHHCTQQENRNCYEARVKLRKQEQKEINFVVSSKKCVNCGKPSLFEEIHKVKGKKFQFCSKRCYNTFLQRSKRKTHTH